MNPTGWKVRQYCRANVSYHCRIKLWKVIPHALSQVRQSERVRGDEENGNIVTISSRGAPEVIEEGKQVVEAVRVSEFLDSACSLVYSSQRESTRNERRSGSSHFTTLIGRCERMNGNEKDLRGS